MKRFFNIVLTIILTILIIVIIGSFGIESSLTKTLSDTFTQKQIASYILDEAIKNYEIDELSEVNENIKSSKYIDTITNKFIKVIVLDISNNKDTNIDISKELNKIIEKDIDGISKDDKETIKEAVDKIDFNSMKDRFVKIIKNNLNENVVVILKVYNVVTNVWLRIVTTILTICGIVIIFKINDNKFNAMSKIGISSIISSIIIIIGTIFTNIEAWHLTNRLLGRTTNINTTFFIVISILDLIIGAGLIITRLINKKKENKSIL